ncbi:hypothetical protein [Streptomyces sp. A0592]|uniref:hypothetical protein n=1 Tax=Streptomyces sp. A0592 TaxID=2563099 RepID=UPI001F0E010C|nr:hypothetical protein [Streptomyces sp. A0592]
MRARRVGRAWRRDRRRDRLPGRGAKRPPPAPSGPTALVIAGADVVVVGFFSVKQKDFAALMDAAASALTARGARVVGRIVQRRGVSDGGVAKMSRPFSSRTLLRYGKVREAADLCERTAADAAVFLTPLTQRQRRVLTEMLGRRALSLAETEAEAERA